MHREQLVCRWTGTGSHSQLPNHFPFTPAHCLPPGEGQNAPESDPFKQPILSDLGRVLSRIQVVGGTLILPVRICPKDRSKPGAKARAMGTLTTRATAPQLGT